MLVVYRIYRFQCLEAAVSRCRLVGGLPTPAALEALKKLKKLETLTVAASPVLDPMAALAEGACRAALCVLARCQVY